MFSRIKTIFWWNLSKESKEVKEKIKNSSVICIGNFDGVHAGHQEGYKSR